jgi:hypothetical protein
MLSGFAVPFLLRVSELSLGVMGGSYFISRF